LVSKAVSENSVFTLLAHVFGNLFALEDETKKKNEEKQRKKKKIELEDKTRKKIIKWLRFFAVRDGDVRTPKQT
jgi:hypothetical protein